MNPNRVQEIRERLEKAEGLLRDWRDASTDEEFRALDDATAAFLAEGGNP